MHAPSRTAAHRLSGCVRIAAVALLSLAAAAWVPAAHARTIATGGATAPNPTTCEGYAEKRVYLENQSWWEPQPGPAGHPGTGKQGHIHVGTCFPLHQRVSGSLRLDLNLHLHNIPGQVIQLHVDAYRQYNHLYPFKWSCPSADCSQTVRVDFPLDAVPVSGWHLINVYVIVEHTDRTMQRNVSRWWVYADNGKPRSDNTADRQPFVLGDSWFTPAFEGQSKYTAAGIANADFPWDDATGEFRRVSGTWRPKLHIQKGYARVLIDPALHADPPREGTVVFDGPAPIEHELQVAVDTTKLADGRHRMLVIGCDQRAQGKHCGVQVVPFVVDNGQGAPAGGGGDHGHSPAPPAESPPAGTPPPASHERPATAPAPDSDRSETRRVPHTGLHAHGAVRHAAHRGGRQLDASLAVSHGGLSEGTVWCAARIAARTLRGFHGTLRNGVARCVWRLPAWAAGKRLDGSIAAGHRGDYVKRRFSAKLAARRA